MGIFSRFFQPPTINWQHTVLGDGTELSLGTSGYNTFAIKRQTDGRYSCSKENKNGVHRSSVRNTYQEAVEWCNLNND